MAAIVRLKLNKYLDEHSITRYQLEKLTGIKYLTIDNYYKNKVTRYDSYLLAKMCEALQCDISDIIELVKEPEE